MHGTNQWHTNAHTATYPMFESGLNYSGVFMFMHVIALCIINEIPAYLPFSLESNGNPQTFEFRMHGQRFSTLLIWSAIIHIKIDSSRIAGAEEWEKKTETDFGCSIVFQSKIAWLYISDRSNEQHLTCLSLTWKMPITWKISKGPLSDQPAAPDRDMPVLSVSPLVHWFFYAKMRFVIKYYYKCSETY